MNNQIENSPEINKHADEGSEGYNYAFVETIARIALYDDLRSAPRVIEIKPARTAEYIENIASKIYEQAKMMGGAIPYTAIREVSENFIHAKFSEIIVSVLDDGNTIRFADQGPGIIQKEKAQLPGFTSAVEPMKSFIRGVGSGLPIVKEYLDISHGSISIEDNLGSGAVITISLKDTPTGSSNEVIAAQESKAAGKKKEPFRKSLTPPLSQRERDFLPLFLNEGALGVTDITRLIDVPQSSTYVTLTKLEEAGLIEKTAGQKRILTDLGYQVANSL